MFRLSREIPNVSPETIFEIGGFKIANSTMLSFLILVIFTILAIFVFRKFKERGTKFQYVIEMAYESILGLVKQITGSKKHAIIIFPLIGALVFYIMTSNLIGLIPGLSTITYDGKAIFRSPTSDFNTTFGLALGCVILLQFVSAKDFGFFGHLGKYFKFKEIFIGFKNGISSGIMSLIEFAIGLLDIIGEFARVVSLSLRLFGNMYAGEVLATLILGAFAYFVPLVWTAMSTLSGVIQSIVFGSLVASYYILSVKAEEEGTEA